MCGERIVYLPLMGRIGNQLFQYAFAYSIQHEIGKNCVVVIDDEQVLENGYVNSLRDYELPSVYYGVDSCCRLIKKIRFQRLLFRIIYKRFIYSENPQLLYKRERKWQGLMNKMGIIAVAKGYADFHVRAGKDYLLFGYFQSERFFEKYRDDIKSLFDLNKILDEINYSDISMIRNRNTVCISIKIEHNLGSSDYDVCDVLYYKKAIAYIEERVENPLYYICSDNLEKAKSVFLKEYNLNAIFQPDNMQASLVICAMSNCKHFIINNTSFGWWGQFLCDNTDKIVVAPKKWMLNDDPVSIYDNQEGWHCI